MKEMQELWDDIADWQDLQFGKQITPTYKIRHLKKEIQELKDSPHDSMEYADCFLLLLGAARDAGMDLEMLLSAIRKKLEINKRRKWGKPNKDGFTEHVKS
jgi:hypothetical protein